MRSDRFGNFFCLARMRRHARKRPHKSSTNDKFSSERWKIIVDSENGLRYIATVSRKRKRNGDDLSIINVRKCGIARKSVNGQSVFDRKQQTGQ